MKRLITSNVFNGKTAGFTMLELSMSILIVGLLFSAVVSLYASYYKKEQQDSVYEELAAVQNALKTFARTNGRYPCPANPTLAVTDAGAAVEATCTPGAPPAGITAVGVGATEVWIGTVPVNTIGLGTGYQKDGYNFKYLYAISMALTAADSIPAPPALEPVGVISVVDQANNNILDTAGTARFFLASYGSTSRGAYTMSGIQKEACPVAAVRESENCDGDSTFMLAPVLEEAGNNFIDDYAMYDQSISRADPSLAEKLSACNSKRMFFKPGDASADADGCVDTPGTLEGACIERVDDFAYDYAGTWNDQPEEFFLSTSVVPTTATVITGPASLTGAGRCTCPGGYIATIDSKIGTWLSPIDSGGSGASPKTRVDTLYICIRS